nr:hypothetical protein GCM10017606_29700 [Microbacterium terregens]
MTAEVWTRWPGVCADIAHHLAERRATEWPALVEAGRIAADWSADGIRVMRAIAASWALIAADRSEPASLYDPAQGGATRDERLATLTDAANRARTAANANRGDREAETLADMIESLRKWEAADERGRAALLSFPTTLGEAA